MGHATAEAVVRGGLQLVPFSFTGQSEAVAVGNVGVSGYPVELIGPERRQEAMEKVLASYPGLIIIDFTLPQAVNGVFPWCADAAGSCQCKDELDILSLSPPSPHTVACARAPPQTPQMEDRHADGAKRGAPERKGVQRRSSVCEADQLRAACSPFEPRYDGTQYRHIKSLRWFEGDQHAVRFPPMFPQVLLRPDSPETEDALVLLSLTD